MKSLYWLRSDLRFQDNHTLNAFCEESHSGVLLWAPTLSYQRAHTTRKEFIDRTLYDFSISLRAHEQTLVVGTETIEIEILKWIQLLSIERVYFTKEYSSENTEDETLVKKICERFGIECKAFDQSTLIAKQDLPFSIVQMPPTFTQFKKTLNLESLVKRTQNLNHKLPPSSLSNVSNASGVHQETAFVTTSQSLRFQPGENAAQARLADYFEGSHAIRTYKDTRNGLLEENDSTKFSVYLNQGNISARQVFESLVTYETKHGANESTDWLKLELLWRDYFKFLNLKQNQFPVRESRDIDSQNFKLWCTGKTTDDFINAHMTELNQTGFMSNRGRQNVASYLIHHLNVPFQWGADYFEKRLIDFDPDLNWGNWLYLSGKGTDPRSRVFNPVRQAEMYDPHHLYRKKWIKS